MKRLERERERERQRGRWRLEKPFNNLKTKSLRFKDRTLYFKALKLMLQMDRIDFTQIHSIWKEGFKECSNMNKTFLSLNSSVCLFV
jgi:hypothetical protein